MIVNIDGIPVYQAILNTEEDGMIRVSLVDEPPVLRDFQAFKDQKPRCLYKIEDEEQRRVFGVVMRADFPIYRRDEAMKGEYYIIYKADTIKEMAEKYLLESRQNNVDLAHDGDDVEGVNMVQFFIKGNGCNPEGFEDIADGSLFAEYHVTNDEVWEAIKAGTYKGFSLEGYFSFVPETDTKAVEDIVEGLDGKFAAVFKSFKDIFNFSNMSKISDFFKALTVALTAVPDNDPAPTKFGSTSTDQGVIFWEGDEDLKADDSVFVEDAEGNRSAAADGEYVTEDGKTIVVVDGKVSEIRDPQAEVAPAEGENEDVSAAAIHRLMASKFGMSFDEKYEAIYAALRAIGIEYPWIAEAGDDYAVVEIWDSDKYSYTRYALSFDADGKVTLGQSTKVKRIFVPEDFADPFETSAELSRVKSELAALKKAPAGQPAHVAFNQASASKTAPAGLQGTKGLQNLARFAKK